MATARALRPIPLQNDSPLLILYYENNVLGSINLLKAMNKIGCKNIIFSSSATVYGDPQYLPLDENHPCKPTNTYGTTKFMVEEIIKIQALAEELKENGDQN